MPTDQEKIDGWTKFMQKYCNNDFLDDEGNLDLPPDIEFIVLPYLTSIDNPNVSGESVSDLSRSFFSSDIPDNIKKILDGYRKLKW